MNQINLCGNLTKDPELTESASGTSICKFSIAVGREFEEGTDFFNCTAFGKAAENISKYFSKGKKILLSGRVKISDFENSEGIKRRSFDVIVNHWEFVEKKNSSYDGEEEYSENVDKSTKKQSKEAVEAGPVDQDGLPF